MNTLLWPPWEFRRATWLKLGLAIPVSYFLVSMSTYSSSVRSTVPTRKHRVLWKYLRWDTKSLTDRNALCYKYSEFLRQLLFCLSSFTFSLLLKAFWHLCWSSESNYFASLPVCYPTLLFLPVFGICFGIMFVHLLFVLLVMRSADSHLFLSAFSTIWTSEVLWHQTALSWPRTVFAQNKRKSKNWPRLMFLFL